MAKVCGLNKQADNSDGLPHKIIKGYIVTLPSSHQNEGESEEEDEPESDDEEWLDYSQMKPAFSGGMFVKRGRRRKNCIVSIQELIGKKRHGCKGHFTLTDPWWEVEVRVRDVFRPQPVRQIIGYPQYALRKDEDGFANQNLVNVLLHNAFEHALKSDKEKQYDAEELNRIQARFHQFVEQEQLQSKLTFQHLESILKKFISMEPLTLRVFRGELIQSVLRAEKFPHLLQFICRLLPRNFLNCFLSCPASKLQELETAALQEPWVFGFNKIMITRFMVYGVEARIRDYEVSGIINTIPSVQKVALYMYDVMKIDAARYGNSYMPVGKLNMGTENRLSHSVPEFNAALVFLTNNTVIVKESFDGRANYFLFHNWKAEVDVAQGLRTVILRGIHNGRTAWDVDYSSPDLQRLQGNADQWAAVQRIVAFPVSVLAGKGGCGKTTVVTSLISHACLRFSMEEPNNNTDPNESQNLESTAEKMMINSPIKPMFSLPQEVKLRKVSEFVALVEKTFAGRCDSGDIDKKENADQKKKMQIKAELTTDLIKCLATTGNTTLSRTQVGSKILLTAPTGKAARLLGHKAKMESCTLHRVVYSYRSYIKTQMQRQLERKRMLSKNQSLDEQGSKDEQQTDDSGHPKPPKQVRGSKPGVDKQQEPGQSSETGIEGDGEDQPWKYADVEVLVVDECSLVSVRLFATLLNILLENSNLWKIILLGDYRQLPSIEPGNFLEDIFRTLESSRSGWSLELKTNHRSESELIVQNATRISEQNLPMFDPGKNFHFLSLNESQDTGDPERDEAVRYLLKNQSEMHSHLPSQFVSFRNNDCAAINEICCRHYNNHSTCLPAPNSRRQNFQIGDKVCLTKNAQIMNHAIHLRHHLEPFPQILEAFEINRPEGSRAKAATCPQQFYVSVAVNRELRSHGADASWMMKTTDEGFEDFDGCSPYEGSGVAASVVRNRGPGMEHYSVKATDYMLHISKAVDPSGETKSGMWMWGERVEPSADARRVVGARQGKLGEGMVEDRPDGKCEGGEESAGTGLPAESKVPSQQKEEEEVKKALKTSEVRLCNGEIFFIMDDIELSGDRDKMMRLLTLSDRDPECPRVVCCSYRALINDCRMRHAWARTIHTYQGSESESVAYFVGSASFQTWKHVYTAVTRGRRSLFIVGQPSQLRTAVKKRDIPRRTRLRHRLLDTIKMLNVEPLQQLLEKVVNAARAAVESQPAVDSPPAFYRGPSVSSSSGVSQHTDSVSCNRHQDAQLSDTPQLTGYDDSPLGSECLAGSRYNVACPAALTSTVAAPRPALGLSDSFPDSDDSWVSSMPPVWEAGYRVSPWLEPRRLFSSDGNADASSASQGGDGLADLEERGQKGASTTTSESQHCQSWQWREREVAEHLAFLDASSEEEESLDSTSPPGSAGPAPSPPGNAGPTPQGTPRKQSMLKRMADPLSCRSLPTPPKNTCQADPADSVVSPVRRSLHIAQDPCDF